MRYNHRRESNMSVKETSILKFFNVRSHKELMDFMKNNPEDEKVIELKKMLDDLQEFDGDTDE